MQTHLKMVKDAAGPFLPQWRLAVSARPRFWEPSVSGHFREYRLLHAQGLACIHYFMGTQSRALECLQALAERAAERAEQIDQDDLPLFEWGERNQ